MRFFFLILVLSIPLNKAAAEFKDLFAPRDMPKGGWYIKT